MGCILVENKDPNLFAMVVWPVWKRRNDMRVGKRGENLPNLVQQAGNKRQRGAGNGLFGAVNPIA